MERGHRLPTASAEPRELRRQTMPGLYAAWNGGIINAQVKR